MRYYIDTNVLIFVLSNTRDDLSPKVADILFDLGNTILVSSIAVQELILLYKIGKMKNLRFKSENDILDAIEKTYFEIVFFNKYHLAKYVKLNIMEGHKDMNDHAIIAQAMTEKIALISSDKEFANYTAQGLNFVFNKR
ncbi:hypothetical protein SAMD00024442_280_1 [Candidatus Symbiothrix dinenymphae]|nr:hypothetical protein SAMD00024442_280_1 [Candidatus Symbiothrix dinenymphae]